MIITTQLFSPNYLHSLKRIWNPENTNTNTESNSSAQHCYNLLVFKVILWSAFFLFLLSKTSIQKPQLFGNTNAGTGERYGTYGSISRTIQFLKLKLKFLHV